MAADALAQWLNARHDGQGERTSRLKRERAVRTVSSRSDQARPASINVPWQVTDRALSPGSGCFACAPEGMP